jgi:hypothetical protein
MQIRNELYEEIAEALGDDDFLLGKLSVYPLVSTVYTFYEFAKRVLPESHFPKMDKILKPYYDRGEYDIVDKIFEEGT